MSKKEKKKLIQLINQWQEWKVNCVSEANRASPGSDEYEQMMAEASIYQQCSNMLESAIKGFNIEP